MNDCKNGGTNSTICEGSTRITAAAAKGICFKWRQIKHVALLRYWSLADSHTWYQRGRVNVCLTLQPMQCLATGVLKLSKQVRLMETSLSRALPTSSALPIFPFYSIFIKLLVLFIPNDIFLLSAVPGSSSQATPVLKPSCPIPCHEMYCLLIVNKT